jgi:sugar fermentation stimulation protein A
MLLPQPLYSGKLIRRYKRFLADVRLDDGEIVTAHCPNSGSMEGCYQPGCKVLLSKSPNPKRKLPFTWELSEIDGMWVGINTMHPNKLVAEAIENGEIPELRGYDSIRREVKYGTNSRIDLQLSKADGRLCYIEVKNVTLVKEGIALFPDSTTLRGQKHLRELMAVKRQGRRAVNFFTVQRPDASAVSAADEIDSVYGKLLRQAAEEGVELIAYQALITPQKIVLHKKLPVVL